MYVLADKEWGLLVCRLHNIWDTNSDLIAEMHCTVLSFVFLSPKQRASSQADEKDYLPFLDPSIEVRMAHSRFCLWCNEGLKGWYILISSSLCDVNQRSRCNAAGFWWVRNIKHLLKLVPWDLVKMCMCLSKILELADTGLSTQFWRLVFVIM